MPFLQFFTDNVQTQSEQDRQRILSGRPSYVVATRELDTDQDFFVRVGHETTYALDAVTSSGILKAKQKLCITFNSDKLGGIDFTKFSKLNMCSAGAGRCWLVQWPGLPPRHCTWSVLKFL